MPQSDADLLITTGETRVQIHAADDQRVVASWLCRPGPENKFTVGAVQDRATRYLFGVQNFKNLIMWHERDTSLDKSKKISLQKPVFSLRVSKHMPVLVVTYTDGGVSVFDQNLFELYNAPGVSKKGKGSDDEYRTTWTRLTSIPGLQGACILMVLTQNIRPTSSTTDKPLLRVFSFVKPSGKKSLPVMQHVSSLHFNPPVQSSNATISAISLHKLDQELGIVWSSGVFQMLQFKKGNDWFETIPTEKFIRPLSRIVPDVDSCSNDDAFDCSAFALDPSCVVFSSAVPSVSGRDGCGVSVWDTRFGVCVNTKVIPYEGEVSASFLEGGEGEEHEGTPTPARKRTRKSVQAEKEITRTDSSIFQVSVSDNGHFVATVNKQSAWITPIILNDSNLFSSIGKMSLTNTLLSNDSKNAIPSVPLTVYGQSTRLPLGPVVNLDSVLMSAIPTNASGSQTSVAWDEARATQWELLASQFVQTAQGDCEAILDPKKTPSNDSIVQILEKYGCSEFHIYQEKKVIDNQRATRAGTKRSAPARNETEAFRPNVLPQSVSLAIVQRCVNELRNAQHSTPGKNVGGIDVHALLRKFLDNHYISLISSPELLDAVLSNVGLPVPEHLRRETESLVKEKERSKSMKYLHNPKSVEALHILSLLLIHVADTHELSLIRIFTTVLHKAKIGALARFWEETSEKSIDTVSTLQQGTSADGKPIHKKFMLPQSSNRPVAGLLYIVGLIVRSPRNDIFLEHSLRTLPPGDVVTLLGCLLRLFNLHMQTLHGIPTAGVLSKTGHTKDLITKFKKDTAAFELDNVLTTQKRKKNKKQKLAKISVYSIAMRKLIKAAVNPPEKSLTELPSLLFPSAGQILDWIRMLVDSHFARLVILARAEFTEKSGSSVYGSGVAQKVNSLGLLALLNDILKMIRIHEEFADAAAPLRGQLKHLLARAPLPQPPEPEYSVETFTI